MEILIVRHGDPNYALDTLTTKGIREAKLLAKRLSKLDVKAFYCSPLGRAKKTASYTLKMMKRKAETLDFLREFEGKVIDPEKGKMQCWDRKPTYWTENPGYYTYDNWYKSELMQSLNTEKEYKRVCEGIDALLEKHGYRHNGKLYDVIEENHDRIVLFCHFGVESVLLSHIFGVSPMIMWHNFVALPTSVTRLVSQEREKGKAIFTCVQYGDLSHLYAGGEEPSFSARWCECYSDETRH